MCSGRNRTHKKHDMLIQEDRHAATPSHQHEKGRKGHSIPQNSHATENQNKGCTGPEFLVPFGFTETGNAAVACVAGVWQRRCSPTRVEPSAPRGSVDIDPRYLQESCHFMRKNLHLDVGYCPWSRKLNAAYVAQFYWF